jgi:hypothetical protein
MWCTLKPIAKDNNMTVGVTNGERLPCLGVYSALSVFVHSKPFCIDFLIITLVGYMRWCSGVTGCAPSSTSFWRLDNRVTWTGLGDPGYRHSLSQPTTSCNCSSPKPTLQPLLT